MIIEINPNEPSPNKNYIKLKQNVITPELIDLLFDSLVMVGVCVYKLKKFLKEQHFYGMSIEKFRGEVFINPSCGEMIELMYLKNLKEVLCTSDIFYIIRTPKMNALCESNEILYFKDYLLIKRVSYKKFKTMCYNYEYYNDRLVFYNKSLVHSDNAPKEIYRRYYFYKNPKSKEDFDFAFTDVYYIHSNNSTLKYFKNDICIKRRNYDFNEHELKNEHSDTTKSHTMQFCRDRSKIIFEPYNIECSYDNKNRLICKVDAKRIEYQYDDRGNCIRIRTEGKYLKEPIVRDYTYKYNQNLLEEITVYDGYEKITLYHLNTNIVLQYGIVHR